MAFRSDDTDQDAAANHLADDVYGLDIIIQIPSGFSWRTNITDPFPRVCTMSSLSTITPIYNSNLTCSAIQPLISYSFLLHIWYWMQVIQSIYGNSVLVFNAEISAKDLAVFSVSFSSNGQVLNSQYQGNILTLTNQTAYGDPTAWEMLVPYLQQVAVE